MRDVVILMVHANPDGHDLVADWYLREATRSGGRCRRAAALPNTSDRHNRDSTVEAGEITNMNGALSRVVPQNIDNTPTGPRARSVRAAVQHPFTKWSITWSRSESL